MCQNFGRAPLIPQPLLCLLLQQLVHQIKHFSALADDQISPEQDPIVEDVTMHFVHVLVEEGRCAEQHLVDDNSKRPKID